MTKPRKQSKSTSKTKVEDKVPTSPQTANNEAEGNYTAPSIPAAATNPPYVVAILNDGATGTTGSNLTQNPDGKVKYALLGQSATGSGGIQEGQANLILYGFEDDIRARYPGQVYPPLDTPPPTTSNTNTTFANFKEIIDNEPTDTRLVFAEDKKSGKIVYSMSANNEFAMIDGMIFTTDAVNPAKSPKVVGRYLTDEQAEVMAKEFYGVPSIMNGNAYINLQGAGGKTNNKYILEKNKIRFYNRTEESVNDGEGAQASTTPSVSEIIRWSKKGNNFYKFHYKYADFVFCKWWQKVPTNYMITLRRYPFPVNDAVDSAEEAQGKVDPAKLFPVATMVTFLGEDPGNKMSTILGPIETGLKWKDLKAQVWEVTTSPGSSDVNNPAPVFGKILGFAAYGGAGTKTSTPGPASPDPYTNGPYANKIIGPINVIFEKKVRDRGLMFKHEISLVFEYIPRSIGSINTKAAGLDILGNIMLMCSATATWWGGQNRFLPSAGSGTSDPFLGGPAGKAAWMRGDVDGFFKALENQMMQIFNNLGDIFNKLFEDPISGLQELAKGGLKEFMNMSTSHKRGTVSGIHSLLTGTATGEWHLTVGSPMNPILMIGNLICTGVKVEFSDELGPDDFPTEIKATITLEHAMPRDKAAIESMFNKGRGRIYSLPKGYEENLTSMKKDWGSSPGAAPPINNQNVAKPDSRTVNAVSVASAKKGKPVMYNSFGGLYAHGFGYNPADSPDNKKGEAAPKKS